MKTFVKLCLHSSEAVQNPLRFDGINRGTLFTFKLRNAGLPSFFNDFFWQKKKLLKFFRYAFDQSIFVQRCNITFESRSLTIFCSSFLHCAK